MAPRSPQDWFVRLRLLLFVFIVARSSKVFFKAFLMVSPNAVLMIFFPGYQWRSLSLSSPARHGMFDVLLGLSFCEERLMYKRQGNDGPWSTFVLRVGTPVQLVWVLASTTVPETWIVDKAGCIKSDPSGCPDSRGKTFNTNASSTWKDAGFYEFGVELNLPYTGNYDSGDYGFDTMGVGYPGGSGSNTTLDRQVVATFATKDFYLGNLGLTPRSINLTGVADGYPSYLSNLKEANMIPSLSFGYNAGAQYRKFTEHLRGCTSLNFDQA